jgi:peptidoglycan/LPS O-acetylase OafA/YrhL
LSDGLSEDNHARNGALDGIRGIAVIIVVLAHTPWILRLRGGNSGVDLFFVLSGFLITTLLLNEWQSSRRISIPHFYFRRACRLFPAAFSVLLFATIAAPLVQPSETLSSWGWDAASILTYVFNWRLAYLYAHGMGAHHNYLLSHYWSLSVEEQFYLIWPALLLLALRLRASNLTMGVLFAVGILSPWIARAILWKHGPSIELYMRSDLHFDGLVCGVGLAWFNHQNMLPSGRTVQRYGGLVGATALTAFLYLSKSDLLTGGEFYHWGLTLLNALSALMLACVIVAPASLFAKALSLGWLRWFGKISYGIYLWHVPMFALSRVITNDPNGRVLVATISTVGIAAVSFRYLETPFLNLKRRFGHPSRPAEEMIPSPA